MSCVYDVYRLLQFYYLLSKRVFSILTLSFCLQLSVYNLSIADEFLDTASFDAALINTESKDVHVTEKDGVYYINASSDISASEQHIRNVLTDYIHIYRLNDSIIESRVLTPIDSDKVYVETLVQCCLPMFCKDVTRVEEVSELNNGSIQTKIIPEKSDFRSGLATWIIEPKGNVTKLSYKASLEPDFFIPPLIGTQFVVSNMRDQFSTTFYRIERIATINEAREWNNNFQLTNIDNKKNIAPCASLSSVDF